MKTVSPIHCTLGIVLAIIFFGLATTFVPANSSALKDDYYRREIKSGARPYTFDYLSWEAEALYNLARKEFLQAGDEADLIRNISLVLRKNDIEIVPPVNFTLQNPPHLLVVSKRETIVYYERVLLSQDLNTPEMEALEAQIDALDLSSLVVELGGFGGTYPPIVRPCDDVSYMIKVAIEEWFHQYLVFKPLGFRYLLDSVGIKPDSDAITINETLADIVSDELGEEVYNTYYGPHITENIQAREENRRSFEFDREMRITRLQVDQFLARGDISGAENYMKVRRDIFLSHGYNIRKLNQAYFAFHGIYAGDPASISPVYKDLQYLRERSNSIREFIEVVSAMTGYADLNLQLRSSPVR